MEGEGEDATFDPADIEEDEGVAPLTPPDELELFGRGGTAYAV